MIPVEVTCHASHGERDGQRQSKGCSNRDSPNCWAFSRCAISSCFESVHGCVGQAAKLCIFTDLRVCSGTGQHWVAMRHAWRPGLTRTASPRTARRQIARQASPVQSTIPALQLPPIVHEVPLEAIERWLRAPSVSPKEEMGKRGARAPSTANSLTRGTRRRSTGEFHLRASEERGHAISTDDDDKSDADALPRPDTR
jgi:hypothetical protein